MILTIDIGNSNIVGGVFDEHGELKFLSRLATDHGRTSDQYAVEMNSILQLNGVAKHDIHGAIISSVVPPLSAIIAEAVTKLCKKRPLIVGPGIKTGLNIRIDDPSQTGSDMVVNAVAATDMYEYPLVIIDMGTATTITYIDENASFMGGLIIPGVRTALTALSEKTAQLPQVSIETPKSVIGTNTVDAMRSGIVFGNAGMIDSIIDRIESERGKVKTIVATGGMSAEICKHCKRKIYHDPNLLLEGLFLLYMKNQPKKM